MDGHDSGVHRFHNGNRHRGFAAGGTGRSSWDLRSHPNRFINENKIDEEINKGGKGGNGNGHELDRTP